MIENALVTPFAVERKSGIRFELFRTSSNLLRTYDCSNIISASLIQECKMKQSSIPHSELSITVDNHDSFFDVTDKSNVYYSLNNKAPCHLFLSSTECGKEILDSAYIKKCRLFFDEINQDKHSVTLKYVSILATPKFNGSYPDIVDVFEELDSTSASARDILECGVAECGYLENVYVPDEINDLMKFGSSSFGEISINTAFHNIAARITNNKKSVYLMVTDDGTITLKGKDTEAVEVISNDKFIDYEILQGDDCLIVKVRDRGNILRQLGDTVEIQDKTKSFKCEIYKQAYNYSNGILSAEWEAVIL